MSTYNSDLYAIQAAPTLRTRNARAREDSPLRFIEGLYTMTGAEAAGDLINIAVLDEHVHLKRYLAFLRLDFLLDLCHIFPL